MAASKEFSLSRWLLSGVLTVLGLSQSMAHELDELSLDGWKQLREVERQMLQTA